jgi:hypothetical protein
MRSTRRAVVVALVTAAALLGALHGCSCEDDLRGVPADEPADEPAACTTDCDEPAATGEIDGCICDEEAGAWLADAAVWIELGDGTRQETTTDAEGCFVLTDVPVGPYTLYIAQQDYLASHAVQVTDGETKSLDAPATCEPPPPGENGSVAGRVCAPDGATWLADATVWVQPPGGARTETTTDVDGRFVLDDVPVGTQTLHVQKGSFQSAREVAIAAGATTTIPDDECELDQDLAIAVVTGRNDTVGDILDDIGVDPATITTYAGSYSTAWGQELLEDYAALSQFDIVFINCGANGIDDYSYLFLTPTIVNSATAVANLRQYVDEGGSVYASDEAYDLIEKAWPDFVDFYGDDTDIDAAQIGVQQTAAVPVTISEPALAAAMGQSTFDIHFNYTLWAIIDAVSADTTVYTRGDAPTSEGTKVDVPLTVGFSPGAGRVLYTSFHQESGANSATQQLLRLLMFEL